MKLATSYRPYLFALGINLLMLLWAWLGVNHGKGLFFFTTDELGLMLLLPLAVFVNLVFCAFALGANARHWVKAFGILLLLLLSGCAAVWIHGYSTGVSA